MLNVAADAVPLLVQAKLERERITTSPLMLAVLIAGVTGIAPAIADDNERAGWLETGGAIRQSADGR